MRIDLRVISADEISAVLEQVAVLAVSDVELHGHGVPMSDRDWENGLGEFSASCLELPTGEQFLLRRLDYGPGGLDVFARLSGDARELTARLLAALDLPAECVTWEVPLEAWRDLEEKLRDYPAGE